MIALAGIAARSAWNRRGNLLLMVLAIALSTALLLGVERVRQQVRSSFAQSVSGTDLIVGARGNPLQLVMYTVFRIGGVDGNVSWQSVQRLASHPLVAWTVPISLGDSHRGFPVLATTTGYFQHYRHGDHRRLRIAQGRRFDSLFDAVIGAEVARRLGYRLGDQIALSHGQSELGHAGRHDEDHDHDHEHPREHADHGDKPFTIVGILAPTGTPVDRTIHIGMEAMQALHLDFQGGARLPGMAIPREYVRRFDLTPKSATAVLVGLKLRSRVFTLQREIAEDTREPLTAVLPGVALDSLWDTIRTGETAMRAISAMVAVVGLAGLASSILAALGARRRELAILRAAGARPREIVALLAMEGMMLMLLGAFAGVALLTAASGLFSGWLEARLGVALPFAWPTMAELPTLAALILAGFLASLLPAWRAYRLSLVDGLNPRI
ncbi:putative ABC transport system permease protein [Cupriavidus gilardii J11]|uniref:Putative ABC transport system permease protein n=1 Tax=Cupriavidus gilardii J11 TaxID=936133 RepID=A0A562BJG5_9BURK|nr:ABC transporter permease [Cupriavidus gilardii]TWG85324.1 putative ABC transport system permease protein [Cupriavidus gilardii J11]